MKNGISSDRRKGIPKVDELTKVLFNRVLNDVFDREFAKRFPGIAFTRFQNEVFIPTKWEDDFIFNENVGYALLEELGLAGKINSIGLCNEDPLFCYGRAIYIDDNGMVVTCCPDKFYQ